MQTTVCSRDLKRCEIYLWNSREVFLQVSCIIEKFISQLLSTEDHCSATIDNGNLKKMIPVKAVFEVTFTLWDEIRTLYVFLFSEYLYGLYMRIWEEGVAKANIPGRRRRSLPE